MMKNNSLLLLSIFLLGLALSISNADSTLIEADQEGNWCAAKADAPEWKLKQFIDNACSQASRSSVDCTSISQGGACFEPNTIRDHASYVLNILYKSRGQCTPDLGIVVHKNPSTRTCNYP